MLEVAVTAKGNIGGVSSEATGASVDNDEGDTALAFEVTMDAVVLIMLGSSRSNRRKSLCHDVIIEWKHGSGKYIHHIVEYRR